MGPGMVLIQGDNAQGKSNLLEAIYLLAIAKSPRASADRELIRWQAGPEETLTTVSALIHRDDDPLRVRVDLRCVSQPVDSSPGSDSGGVQGGRSEGGSVQKYIRVNGVPRRASDLVGQVNAVMFSADDLELVYGSPMVRRRYLDILISQLDSRYLKVLQRYQKVVYQRNHLLRTIREGRSRTDELDYWDGELVSEGTHLISRRLRTVGQLSELAGPMHKELSSNGEELGMVYLPNIPIGTDNSDEGLAAGIRTALAERRQREIAQGVTVSGPHRDDLQILIEGMDAGAYASRGQSRTAVLSMKLAEARFLADERGQEPLLLLDDMLSELDSDRRDHILASVSRYQQCLITTTEPELIGVAFLSRMSRFVVRQGRIDAVGATTPSGNDLIA